MSPTNVSNFVHDLVEMAKAMEELPVAKNDLEVERRVNSEMHVKVQNLELKIIAQNDTIDSLRSTIRSLEVERDDALFQAMAADDRTDKALAFVKGVFGNAGALIQALEPPRVEPEAAAITEAQRVPDPQPAPVPANGQGHSAVDPTTQTTTSTTIDAPADTTQPIAIPTQSDASITGHDTGQSEPLPPQADASSVGEASATSSGDGSHSPAPTQADASPRYYPAGPYYGKRYIDVQGYVSRQDWLNGGGTEEDYDYRPEHNLHTA